MAMMTGVRDLCDERRARSVSAVGALSTRSRARTCAPFRGLLRTWSFRATKEVENPPKVAQDLRNSNESRARIASECVYTVQRQPRKMHARTGEQLRTFGGEVTEPIDELGHERRRPPKRGTCARERERGSLVPTCARSRDAALQHPRARLCGFGD